MNKFCTKRAKLCLDSFTMRCGFVDLASQDDVVTIYRLRIILQCMTMVNALVLAGTFNFTAHSSSSESAQAQLDRPV